MNINFIDTHAHLCDLQFQEDRNQTLQRAMDQNITTIVEIADSADGWLSAQNLAEQSFSNSNFALKMFWTCGFHPHYAKESNSETFQKMLEIAKHPLCVAIGEIGLDYVKSAAPKDQQIQTFIRCLEIASELNKPVVIHCREAQADTLRILKSFYGGTSRRDWIQGVIHCFAGDISFAEGCIDLGFYLGVDGPITYPSAQMLRNVIQQIPLDRIVLETDCPYLPPQPFRGKRNEPAHLPLIAQKISELFQTPLSEIAKITSENATKLYRISQLKNFNGNP